MLVLLGATAAFAIVAAVPWQADAAIRRATAIAIATLILWISEVAPLGIVALWIPIAATATGILTWKQALSAWGDEIVFQFLGAFLLARALDKHGAFDWVGRMRFGGRAGPLVPALLVMLISGTISTMQNNTAVAAMLLPATIAIARLTRMPALPMLALSYGATFGGMATPVGTAPNFIGYRAMSAVDPSVSFVSWMSVGVPVWIGITLLGWGVLALVFRFAGDPNRGLGRWLGCAAVGSAAAVIEDPMETRSQTIASSSGHSARVAAWIVFALAAATWLTIGVYKSTLPADAPAIVWIERYVPDSLVPIAAAIVLFLWPAGPQRRPILEASDLQTLDWDTLFLIAGGLCLGLTLSQSGAAKALAGAVASLQLSQLLVMLAIGGATVLLSELTSNTATAGLMVPIAASLAPAVDLPGTTVIWLVALCASLGFALPVSTPPNAIVYGTRMIPLRLMIFAGLLVDIFGLLWIVACLRVLG
jgi:sodium-dependent dicarboxylate transporter 2/3/5